MRKMNKTTRDHYASKKWLKSRTRQHHVLVRMQSNGNSHSLLVNSGRAILKDSLVVSYKTKHIPIT